MKIINWHDLPLTLPREFENGSADMKKIRKCPFCGSDASYTTHSRNDGYCSYMVGVIKCTNNKCRCQTPELTIDGYYGETTSEQDVYDLWNRRY